MQYYYNLTQCAQRPAVYFRSTDVEQMNWHRLLWSVPDEWLFLLYCGESICVIDKSTGRGKIERIFIPVLNDLLTFLIEDKQPSHKDLLPHFAAALEALKADKSLRCKFTFWTDRITGPIHIGAMTVKVDREENHVTKSVQRRRK